MTSKIKILRKLISMDLNLGTLTIDRSTEYGLEYYSASRTRTLYYKRNNKHHHHILSLYNNELYLNNIRTMIIREQDFLDSDDISLVLRHGRDILDENIIENYNRRYDCVRHTISLSTFNVFLN